tara:strand:+ start:12659 stop:12838 length:180 start_codon:yes stop_codon:yes gene_type:complete
MSVLASKEERDKRWKICQECKHLTSLTKQCKLCGCFMKIKTTLKNTECADNPKKWKKEK